MDELFGFLCWSGFLLLVVTVVGHGIWLLAARAIRAMTGAPPKSESPFSSATDPMIEPRRDILGMDRQIGMMVKAGRIQPEVYAALRDELETYARRLHLEMSPRVVVADLRETSSTESSPETKPTGPASPTADSVSTPLTGKLQTGEALSGDWAVPLDADVSPIDAEVVLLESATQSPFQTPAGLASSTPVGASHAPRSNAPPLRDIHALDREYSDVPRPATQPPIVHRAFGDVLQSFLEEKNIRWAELVSGLLIVGSAIGLVVSLRSELSRSIPFFPALLFLGITAAIHGAGMYTLHRWKLPTTSRGLLLIAMLLVPLNATAACVFTDREVSGSSVVDPWFLAAVTVGTLAWGAIAWQAGRSLVPGRALPWMLAVMSGAIAQPWINRLGAGEPSPFLQVGLLSIPVAMTFMAAITFAVAVRRERIGDAGTDASLDFSARTLTRHNAEHLLMIAGLGFFSLATAVVLAVARADDWGLAVSRLAIPAGPAAAILLAAGVALRQRVDKSVPAAFSIAGTSLAILAGMSFIGGLAAAWPDPPLVMATAASGGASLLALAWVARLPWLQSAVVAHAAVGTLTAVHHAAGRLLIDATSAELVVRDRPAGTTPTPFELYTAALLDGVSGLTLSLLAAGVAAIAAAVWFFRPAHAGPFRAKITQAGTHAGELLRSAAGLAAIALAIALFSGITAERVDETWIAVSLVSLAAVAAIAVGWFDKSSAAPAISAAGAVLLAMVIAYVWLPMNEAARSVFGEPEARADYQWRMLGALFTFSSATIGLGLVRSLRRERLVGETLLGFGTVAAALALPTSLAFLAFPPADAMEVVRRSACVAAIGALWIAAAGKLRIVPLALIAEVTLASAAALAASAGIERIVSASNSTLASTSNSLRNSTLAFTWIDALPVSLAVAAVGWAIVAAWARRLSAGKLTTKAASRLSSTTSANPTSADVVESPSNPAGATSASWRSWSTWSIDAWRGIEGEGACWGQAALAIGVLLLCIGGEHVAWELAACGLLVAMATILAGTCRRLHEWFGGGLAVFSVVVWQASRSMSLTEGEVSSLLGLLVAAPLAYGLFWTLADIVRAIGETGTPESRSPSQTLESHSAERSPGKPVDILPTSLTDAVCWIGMTLAMFLALIEVVLVLRGDGGVNTVGLLHDQAGLRTPGGWTLLGLLAATFVIGVWKLGDVFRVIRPYWFGMIGVVVIVSCCGLSSEHGMTALVTALGATVAVAGVKWRRRDVLGQFSRAIGGQDLRLAFERGITSVAVSQVIVAAAIAFFALWMVLLMEQRELRYCAALATLLGGAGVALTTWARLDAPPATRANRDIGLALFLVALALFGWADLDSIWNEGLGLSYAVRLLLAMSVATIGMGIALPRIWIVAETWRGSVRRTTAIAAAAAVFTLIITLLLEVDQFDRVHGVPLSGTQSAVVLLVLASLTAGLIFIAMVPKRDPLALPLAGRMGYVYGAEVIFGLAILQVYLSMPWLFNFEWRVYWPYFSIAAAFGGATVATMFERRGLQVLGEPLFRSFACLPIVPVIGMWVIASEGEYDVVLLMTAVFYLFLASLRSSTAVTLLAGAFANAALLTFYGRFDGFRFVDHPQLWLIPPAVSTLAAVHWHRDRLDDASAGFARYACVAVIYISSTSEILLTGFGRLLWPPMILATLAVVGVLAGMGLRIRSFLYFGVGFLFVSMIAMVSHAQQAIEHTWPWWAFGVTLGIAVLVFFGFFEKKRAEISSLAHRLKTWEQ